MGTTVSDRGQQSEIIREPMPYGKVLVVDDMKSNLDVAKLLLNPYRLQIDTAESGFEAIDIIKSGKVYDIVFMDHMMPKMDGVETVKRLRDLGYTRPVFALTASDATGQREMFLANGFDGFIFKPIDIRQLNDSLNKYIRDRKHERGEEPDSAFVIETQAAAAEGAALNIPGLDTEAGLALYGRDREIYLSVLRSYVSNISSLMDRMRNVTKETLPDYAVGVHGLKGICSGIGAVEAAKASYDLEMTAKAGNLAGVLAGNEALLKDTENLVSGIKAWLGEYDGMKPLLPCPDKVLLAGLRKCCEAYDMNGVDDIMDELEGSSYIADASLVTWLREKIDESDFSSVVSRLSEYAQ